MIKLWRVRNNVQCRTCLKTQKSFSDCYYPTLKLRISLTVAVLVLEISWFVWYKVQDRGACFDGQRLSVSWRRSFRSANQRRRDVNITKARLGVLVPELENVLQSSDFSSCHSSILLLWTLEECFCADKLPSNFNQFQIMMFMLTPLLKNK